MAGRSDDGDGAHDLSFHFGAFNLRLSEMKIN
jgi:hypothetical protein